MADPNLPTMRHTADPNIAAKEAFFARLPNDELNPSETTLRQVLLDFLHERPTSSFPLIDWIDRRIGGEIETLNGEIYLRGAGPGAEPDKKVDKQVDKERFFAGLPAGAFSSEEEALRDSVFAFLALWRSRELATLANMGNDPEVSACRNKFLAKGISLKDWIERRIGGEVELKERDGQQVVLLCPAARVFVMKKFEEYQARAAVRGKGGAPPGVHQPGPPTAAGKGAARKEPVEDRQALIEEWFRSLPGNELKPSELALREAILAALKKSTQHPPLLSDLSKDNEVSRGRVAMRFPNYVPLYEWIDRRVGGEIELKSQGQAQFQVFLRGEAGATSAGNTGKASSRGKAADVGGAAAAKGKAADGGGAPAKGKGKGKDKPTMNTEEFLSALPGDQLSEDESTLREALLSYLQAMPVEQPPPLLSDACKEKSIAESRAALLPAEVPFRLWIDRRIGGEVATHKDDKGRFVISLQNRPFEEPAPKKQITKEQFFADLPDDGFTPEEETLREAVLNFLSAHRGADNPHTLSDCANDAEVKTGRTALIPRGIPVSLKEWVERRIGGEVEFHEVGSNQWAVGLLGTLDKALLDSKKRRAEDRGGSNAPSKGKGGKGNAPPSSGGRDRGWQEGNDSKRPRFDDRPPSRGGGYGDRGNPSSRGPFRR